MQFDRVLLKLSGEALKSPGSAGGIDPATVTALAGRIAAAAKQTEMAIVVGAGNLFRGLAASHRGATRVTADSIGMLGTMMNALALQDALEQAGCATLAMSAIAVPGVVAQFNWRQACQALEAGKVVLLAGGTGHPFFTTDTTAALRACEIGAGAILKATKVNGVYSADPVTNPGASRYRQLAYDDALEQRLQVMDAAAFSLCRDNNIPILVFDFGQPDSLMRAIGGDHSVGTLVCQGPTQVDA